MKELLKQFDVYSFKARVQPAFFLMLPIALVLLVWYEPIQTIKGGIVGFLGTFGVLQFVANQMSSKGNGLQDRLFEKWGASPSTIIMRHSDDVIDNHTKERYFDSLSKAIKNFQAPTQAREENKPLEADKMYNSAGHFLREFSRDTKKFPLVFKELTNYGFSRNLCAFKGLGFSITLLSFCISIFLLWFNHVYGIEKEIVELVQTISIEKLLLPIGLFIYSFIWMFLINIQWVKTRAFAYAKALFSVCERLPKD